MFFFETLSNIHYIHYIHLNPEAGHSAGASPGDPPGNLWRRLGLSHRIRSWSLTSLQHRLMKTDEALAASGGGDDAEFSVGRPAVRSGTGVYCGRARAKMEILGYILLVGNLARGSTQIGRVKIARQVGKME